MDGSRNSSDPRPSETMSGNAPAPRATGGQMTPVPAIRIGQEHRDADQQVQRPAGSVRHEDQYRRHRPGDDEGGPDQAELELAYTHVMSLARDGRSRTATSTGAAWDRRVIATVGLRGQHARTAPEWPGRGQGPPRGTWDMAGPAHRGSRGRGRSPRDASSSRSRAVASAVASGPMVTRPPTRRPRTQLARPRTCCHPRHLPDAPDAGPRP